MRILVLAGMPGSGKEEFVQVALSQGYGVVRMGDVVRAEAARRGVPNSDKGVGGFADSERKQDGPDIWARRCLPYVKEERTLIDGSRSLDELEVFRQAFGEDLMLVAIHAPPRARYGRLLDRGRDDAPRSWEEFAERDRREMSWGLGGLVAMADVMLLNTGSLASFRRKVRDFLEDQG
jgi:dephospho-CoA kinase